MQIGLLRRAAIVWAATFTGTLCAQSLDYPANRVTLVVPFAAGGPTDTVARLVGTALQDKWRQTVLIDNRPGAGTVIATEAVAKAKPDGYTILINADINPLRIFSKLNFDPLKDLKPATKLMAQYFVVVTTPGIPARTLGEFIAYAKQRPKALNYAQIPFTQYQIEYPVFFEKAGIELTPVPYNSAAPITPALLNNEVQLFFGSVQLLSPHIASGKLTALATTGAKRAEQLPTVPTVREGGVDYDTSTWYGLYVPAGTPDATIARISADSAQAIRTPEVSARLKQLGYEIFGTSGPEMAQELAATARTYDEVAKKFGFRPQ